MIQRIAPLVLILALAGGASAQDATFQTKTLTPETALKAAQVALEFCRKQGYQTAIAVVDRSGVLQVLLRDRYAGAHTPGVATDKAWTSASFKTSTLEFAKETQAGRPMSGIRDVPRVIAAGGGLPIEAGGSLLGAIGVSGAPGGEADEACARAGIKAIADSLEF
ncbi:MAG: heme-binding protein [Hylemonella sp.]|uniref:GlcG/HbpS family heme-binding protein n=1 Tax=Hylemonella sp. TaxID=2066020 RepID=UPI0022CCC5B9|nr:heme-binding protein [Hylemonella sp.]MCZ8251085.1 heme-binding protein [Hylemonella sp.]